MRTIVGMLDSYEATPEGYDAPVMNVYFRDGGPYQFYLTEEGAAAYLPERNKNQYLSNPDVYVITDEEMYPDLVDKSPTPCHTRPLLALVLALVHALACGTCTGTRTGTHTGTRTRTGTG